MKFLTQKITLFGFLEVEGKKMVLGNMDCWVLNKNSNQRELTHTRSIWSFQLGASKNSWVKRRIQT